MDALASPSMYIRTRSVGVTPDDLPACHCCVTAPWVAPALSVCSKTVFSTPLNRWLAFTATPKEDIPAATLGVAWAGARRLAVVSTDSAANIPRCGAVAIVRASSFFGGRTSWSWAVAVAVAGLKSAPLTPASRDPSRQSCFFHANVLQGSNLHRTHTCLLITGR